MIFSVGYRMVFCYVIMTVKGTFCQMKPSNAVTEIGGEAIFNCSGSSFLPNWFRAKDGTDANRVGIAGSGCAVAVNLRNHYSTEQTAVPNSCNLIVFNVTMNEAGVYWCSESGLSYALLTVLEKDPLLTYNATGKEVEEHDSVVMECSLNYTGSAAPAPQLQPYFYWTNAGGQPIPIYSNSTTDSTAVSQLTVTAGRSNIPSYSCHVYFQLDPPFTPSYSNDTPTICSNASSPIIEVSYYPNITSITSTVSTTDKCVYKQESLTCAAEANPPASYEWLDLSNNVKTIGSVRSISSGGQYQCIAYNTIRSLRYNDTKIASEATCYSPYNLTMGGSNCVNNSCSCPDKLLPVSLSCTADGYPKPTIHWWSDVPEMEDLGNNPTIDVIIDGNYNCTASNAYGGQPYIATSSMSVTNCQPHPTTTPSTLTTRTVVRTTESSSPTIAPTTTPKPYPVRKTATRSLSAGDAAGITIGCFIVIANVVAIVLFMCCCYGKLPESETNACAGSAKSKSYKNRLNRRFPWLKKMLPCLNDTHEEAGSNIPWVLLFAFLGTVTGVVTFPVWICLASKSDKKNEASSLTRRENGGAEDESAGNGMSPTNYPPPDYPPDAPPFQNRKRGQQQNDHYQNSSTVNIELVISHHSQNRMTDSPKPNTSPAWKPTPPDKNVPSGPAKKYATTDPVIADSPLYADLPLKLNQIPLKPQQYLDDPENTYAPLKII